MTDPLDIESVICKQLIDNGIAGGNVIIADRVSEFNPPAVFVSMSSQTGNVNEGLWDSVIIASCVENEEYAALRLASEVRRVLDGYGGNGIKAVEHQSTIPQRTVETAPVTHTFVVTFRVLHQE